MKGYYKKRCNGAKKFVRSLFVLLIIIAIAIQLISCNNTSQVSGNNIDSAHGTSDNENNNLIEENQTIENDGNMASITILHEFSGGVSNATLQTNDGISYEALIDIGGNVRYLCDESEYIFYSPTSENDICWIRTKDSSEYKLINVNGEIIKSSDGNDSSEVVACGNGYALIYQHKSSINSETHLYGVIDNKGNWVVPLTDYGQEPFRGYGDTYSKKMDISASYVGSNIFDIRIGFFEMEHMLINATTGKAFWVYTGWTVYRGYEGYDAEISFDNGVHYFVCKGGADGCAFVSDRPLRENGEIDGEIIEQKDLYKTTHDFVLYPDGTWKKLPDDFPVFSGYKAAGDKWIKEDGEYLKIYDYDTKKEAEFKNYPLSIIDRSPNFVNGKAFVFLNGKDNKKYLTMIDSTGKMKFEPIVFSDVKGGTTYSPDAIIKYIEGKIIFINEQGLFNVADDNGNILLKDLKYEWVYDIIGDLLLIKDDERNKLVDFEGNVVLDKIKLPDNIN